MRNPLVSASLCLLPGALYWGRDWQALDDSAGLVKETTIFSFLP